jgi:uncharacterized Fe-S cluster protein YjdI
VVLARAHLGTVPGMARRDYRAPGLVIHWDSDRCTHASRCWRNLPEVFQPWAKPWIEPAGADADRIRRVIRLCPTGAISFTDVPVEAADGWKAGCAPDVQAEVDAAAARQGSGQAGTAGPDAPGAADEAEAAAGSASSGSAATVSVTAAGPLLVDGVRVLSAGGRVLVAEGRAALCRCGGSGRKPFCDGSHARLGFTDPGTGPEG